MKEISSGFLRMMDHEGIDPVEYIWVVASYPSSESGKQEAKLVPANFKIASLVGKRIKLEFTGKIRCVNCGKITSKSFNQGSCFQCFQTLAENDLCILRPETCHFHLGTCREPEWGEGYCFQKHTVYLANTSGLKVGITREKPVSNRWVDQGAQEAIPLLEVSSRRDAGLIEKQFTTVIDDKTKWQKMVTEDSVPFDLVSKKKELLEVLDSWDLGVPYAESDEQKITKLSYPISEYPKKSKSFSPDKEKEIDSKLLGIKGQYLLFEDVVINIRAYGGYEIRLYSE